MGKIRERLRKYNQRRATFLEALQALLQTAKESASISLETIFKTLSKKGYAALFIIFSLPFCLPIQIPGFSTPFGLLLAFLSLRFIFGKRLWWPKWILKKQVSGSKVAKLTEKGIKVVKWLKKFSSSRYPTLTQNVLLLRAYGAIIFILSLLLLLPLPIPFSNMLTALPILCIGIGLLEDDGVFMILGVTLFFICIIFFAAIYFLGKSFLSFFGILPWHS